MFPILTSFEACNLWQAYWSCYLTLLEQGKIVSTSAICTISCWWKRISNWGIFRLLFSIGHKDLFKWLYSHEGGIPVNWNRLSYGLSFINWLWWIDCVRVNPYHCRKFLTICENAKGAIAVHCKGNYHIVFLCFMFHFNVTLLMMKMTITRDSFELQF